MNEIKNIKQYIFCSNIMNISKKRVKKDTNECPSKPDETPAEDIVVMKGIKN